MEEEESISSSPAETAETSESLIFSEAVHGVKSLRNTALFHLLTMYEVPERVRRLIRKVIQS